MRFLTWFLAFLVVSFVAVAGWRVAQSITGGAGGANGSDEPEAAGPERSREGENAGTRTADEWAERERGGPTAAASGRDVASEPDRNSNRADESATDEPAADAMAALRIAEIREELARLGGQSPADAVSMRRLLGDALDVGGPEAVALLLDVAEDPRYRFPGYAGVVGEMLRGLDDERIVPRLIEVVERAVETGEWRDAVAYLDRIADEPERSSEWFVTLLDAPGGSMAVEVMRRLPAFEGHVDAGELFARAVANPDRAAALLSGLHGFQSSEVRVSVRELVLGSSLPEGRRAEVYERLGATLAAADLTDFVAPFSSGDAAARTTVLAGLRGLAANPEISIETRREVATPLLTDALGSEHRDVRRMALTVLSRDAAYNDSSLVGELARLADSADTTEERITVQRLLERMRDREFGD